MKKKIANQYIELLSQGNAEGLISLFAENGMVHSPIYGEKKASDFYKILAEDTQKSELKLIDIFHKSDTGNIAVFFEYKWTVKSGKMVLFNVVDIIEFDEQHKIVKLQIIYDTVVSRQLIKEMKT